MLLEKTEVWQLGTIFQIAMLPKKSVGMCHVEYQQACPEMGKWITVFQKIKSE